MTDEILKQSRHAFRRSMAKVWSTRRDASPERTTIFVATTDYVNETEDGYINPHLYRVPITVTKVRL